MTINAQIRQIQGRSEWMRTGHQELAGFGHPRRPRRAEPPVHPMLQPARHLLHCVWQQEGMLARVGSHCGTRRCRGYCQYERDFWPTLVRVVAGFDRTCARRRRLRHRHKHRYRHSTQHPSPIIQPADRSTLTIGTYRPRSVPNSRPTATPTSWHA